MATGKMQVEYRWKLKLKSAIFNHYGNRIYGLKAGKHTVLSVKRILRCRCFSDNSPLFCNM